MNRPLTLLKTLIMECSEQLGTSTTRCVQTLEERFAHEGFSFFTITLPRLCDWLESGLELGYCSSPPLGFKRKPGTCLPAFLQGFTSLVFEDTGMLRHNSSVEAIDFFRQITRFFKKLKIACSDEREAAAERRFIALELEMQNYDGIVTRDDPILDEVCKLIGRIFSDFNPESLVCRHGPGVTADRLAHNERLTIRSFPRSALACFPLEEHCVPNYLHYEDLQDITILEDNELSPVRVVFVPKTSTTPRVIAIEPSYMQYMQQSLRDYIYTTLERRKPTKGRVNFSDQSINRALARKASLDRSLATPI